MCRRPSPGAACPGQLPGEPEPLLEAKGLLASRKQSRQPDPPGRAFSRALAVSLLRAVWLTAGVPNMMPAWAWHPGNPQRRTHSSVGPVVMGAHKPARGQMVPKTVVCTLRSSRGVLCCGRHDQRRLLESEGPGRGQVPLPQPQPPAPALPASKSQRGGTCW